MRNWTKDEEDKMRVAWTKYGFTYNQMAEMLKRTRNQVAGKIYRLGLTGKKLSRVER